MEHFYRALHSFKAEEIVELSVNKGELLRAVDDVVQDGWIKVEVVDDKDRRGFVPLSYLQREGEGTSPTRASSQQQQRQQSLSQRQHYSVERRRSESGHSSPGRPSGAQSTSPYQQPRSPRSFSSAAQQYGDSIARHDSPKQRQQRTPRTSPYKGTSAGSSGGSPQGRLTVTEDPQYGSRSSPMPSASGGAEAARPLTPAQAASGPVSRDLLSNPNSVVDTFMKNEIYFKQLMRQRSDALSVMQTELEEAMTEVAACKDKQVALSRKLRDLDQVVDHERRRSAERVEEEKAFVAQIARM